MVRCTLKNSKMKSTNPRRRLRFNRSSSSSDDEPEVQSNQRNQNVQVQNNRPTLRSSRRSNSTNNTTIPNPPPPVTSTPNNSRTQIPLHVTTNMLLQSAAETATAGHSPSPSLRSMSKSHCSLNSSSRVDDMSRPLWTLWTLWDPTLRELTKPSASCPKRRRIEKMEFRRLFLNKLKALPESFNFPSDSSEMLFMTVEVVGGIYLPSHRKFANIPVRFCTFMDVTESDENWTVKAHSKLGILLAMTFKIGDILLILGGMMDAMNKRITLCGPTSRTSRMTHIIHQTGDGQKFPENPDLPFDEEWTGFATSAKLQLIYCQSKEYTILKTMPYCHQNISEVSISIPIPTPPPPARVAELPLAPSPPGQALELPLPPPPSAQAAELLLPPAEFPTSPTLPPQELPATSLPGPSRAAALESSSSPSHSSISNMSDSTEMSAAGTPSPRSAAWNANWRPRRKNSEKSNYEYSSLQGFKDRLDQQQIQVGITGKNLGVYGVVVEILQSDKPSDYKIRISDETKRRVLVRIHTAFFETIIGPKMYVDDIIRIHRICIQKENHYNESEMVISTSSHHNYVLYNYNTNVNSPILCATSAKQITQTSKDRARVIELRKWILKGHEEENDPPPPIDIPQEIVHDEENETIGTGIPENESRMEVDIIQNQSQDSVASMDVQIGSRTTTESNANSEQPITDENTSSQSQSQPFYTPAGSVVSMEIEIDERDETIQSFENVPVSSLEGLQEDTQNFSMKIVVLRNEFLAESGELSLRVSDGTESLIFTFKNSLDGQTPNSSTSTGMPFVDILIRNIETNPELWDKINEVGNSSDLWVLTNVQIVLQEGRRLRNDKLIAQLVVNAQQTSFKRCSFGPQTIVPSGIAALSSPTSTIIKYEMAMSSPPPPPSCNPEV